MALTKPRAYQIYDIDYKQAVRVVTTINIVLASSAPNEIDGVNLSTNDRVLVTAQSNPEENGIYTVQAVGIGATGTWVRSGDTNTTGELLSGTIVMVTEGLVYADTQWKLITDDPITLGVTELTFVQNYSANSISSGTSNVVVGSNANVSISVAGTSNVLVIGPAEIDIAGNIIPTSNVTYSLGNTTNRFKDLYIANNSIYIGDVTIGSQGSELTVNGATVVTASGSSTLSLSGNITGGNLISNAAVIATGNIETAGNIIATGNINTVGTLNINSSSGMYNILNITGTALAPYGSSQTWKFFTQNAVPGGPGSWILFPDSSTQTTAYPGTSTALSLTGNITGGNIDTAGLITSTSNITGGNIHSLGLLEASGNIVSVANVVGSNLQSLGAITAVGNITGGNIDTAGLITSTGNITGGNISGTNLTGTIETASQPNITSLGTLTSLDVAGNIDVGNVNTDKIHAVSALFTGNVDIIGNLNATVGLVYANSGIFLGDAVTGNNAAYAGVPGFTQLGSNVVMQFAGNVNSYSQINFENVNSGSDASGDFIITADNGNDSENFVDLGIGSSTYSYSGFPAYGPNDAYLLNNGGNLLLNPQSPGKEIHFIVGGSDTTDIVATLSNTQLSVDGVISASGNITGGNVNTAGQVVATGNITGGNLNTGAQVVATGNITGGNVNTAGVVRATGDVFGKELWSTQSSGDEGGQINLGIPATGTSLTGQVTIDIYQNRLRFFQGNNAKGAFIDLTATADGVGTNLLAGGGGGGSPGGSNTNVQFNDDGIFGGNANFTYDKFFNTVNAGTFAGTINGIGQNFKVGDDAWIGDINIDNTIGLKGQQNGANCYIVFGNSDATGKLGRAGTGPLTYSGAFTATGNITGGNLIQDGTRVIKWTTVANTAPTNAVPGDFWYDSYNDTKFQYINDGTSNVWVDQGFPTTFSTISVGSILNTNANGVGNIGTSGGSFNTVFAKATSAQYADLAEIYESDADYAPGTVVVFGGEKEITISTQGHDTRVAGVISTQPAYIMNSMAAGLPVAFTGRVPCRVQGPVNKGDVIVTSTLPGTAQKIGFNYQPGCVIGKSLEAIEDSSVKIIEVVVGRF